MRLPRVARGLPERAGRVRPRRGAAVGLVRRCGREGAGPAAGRARVVPGAGPAGRRGDPARRALGGRCDAVAQVSERLGGAEPEVHPGILVVPRRSAPRRPAFPRRAGVAREAPAGLKRTGSSALEERMFEVAGRVYAVANQKGGVGKTTTAVNLAACLAEAGERALVIDLDPQANATSGLGERANGTSSYDLLDGAPLEQLAKPTRFQNLWLVPVEARPGRRGGRARAPRRRRAVPRRVAGRRRRRLLLRLPRLPAVARPADRERAGGRRPGARPGAGRVLRARGPLAAAALGGHHQGAAQPAARRSPACC